MRIWKRNASAPKRPEDLTVDARRILGILITCGIKDPDRIAVIMHVSKKQVIEMLKGLKKSKEKTIKEILKDGLPIQCSTSIFICEKRVTCKQCKSPITHVPCGFCSCRKTELHGKHKLPRPCKGGLPESGMPTYFPPGSLQKLDTMRNRVAAGFSVFCRDDAPLDDREKPCLANYPRNSIPLKTVTIPDSRRLDWVQQVLATNG